MLQNCLPDGGCFTRQGMLVTEGRNLVVIATGARTSGPHLLQEFDNTYRRSRCPGCVETRRRFSQSLPAAPYKERSAARIGIALRAWERARAICQIQTSCNGKPCEGFSVSLGGDLPPLQPNQLSLYSEKCSTTDTGDREPISTVMPHEQLAQIIVTLIPQGPGPAFYDWKTLTTSFPHDAMGSWRRERGLW